MELLPPIQVTAGGNPREIVAEDLDNDLIPDLVLLQQGISLLRGVGDGTFAAWPSISSPNGSYLAASDLDGDGITDLLVAEQNFLMAWKGEGGGAFIASATWDLWNLGFFGTSGRLTVEDIDLDGAPDVVMPSYSTGTVSIVLHPGSEIPAVPLRFAGGYRPIAAEVSDVDGDGLPDVVTLSQVGTQLFGNTAILSQR